MPTEDQFDYLGEPIVAEDSFLRDLPSGVSLEDRLRLHAVVLSCDIIVRGFNDLRTVACEIGADVKAYRSVQLAILIGSCWTIVDQLHTCRQLLFQASRGKPGPLMSEFLQLSKPVSRLRNRMDHLKDNLQNLAQSRKRLGPLSGIVSYLYSGLGNECHNISIGSGALREKMDIYRIDPRGKRVNRPIDHFEFTAFGETLAIAPALLGLKNLMNQTSDDIQSQFSSHVDKLGEIDPNAAKGFALAGLGIITVLETISIEDATPTPPAPRAP